MLKIALIDDEKIVLRGIAALMKKEPGFELVGTAENGIDGLQMILETKPDIVMTDIRMPGMSGLEMIKKRKKKFRKVSILSSADLTNLNTLRKPLVWE